MKISSHILHFSLRFAVALIPTLILWVAFIYTQQLNYRQPNQIYLLGTNAAYAFTFFFLLITSLFVLSFYKNRHHPAKLRSRFIFLACFYILSSPLVLLSFNNYLLVTKEGIQYNPFFEIQPVKIQSWDDMERLTLDYTITGSKQSGEQKLTTEELRLKFIVKFDEIPSYDLNNYNSPLYTAEQFLTIYHYMKSEGVTVERKRPLPDNLQNGDSFFYQLFKPSP